MWLSALWKPRPTALARLDEHALDLGIVGQEMLDQVQAKIFQWLDGMLAGQSVHRVGHRVGGEDLAIVTLGVCGFKVAFEANRKSDLADVVTALLLRDAK